MGAVRKLLKDRVRFDNLDAAESAFFRNQLELVKARTYDRRMVKLRAREFVPLDGEVDNATQTYTWRSYDQVGAAILLSSYADNLPRSDVFAKEESVQIKGLGASYGYSIQEVRAAQKAGVALESKKAAGARRGIEVMIDRILATGDASSGMKGLLNQPNALTYTVPAGASTSTTWALKTPAEKLADLIGIVEYIVAQTEEVEMPDTIIMPRAQFTLIRTERFSNSSDRTTMEWFAALYPEVALQNWKKCIGAGAGSTDRMIAYSKNVDQIAGIIPQEFEQFPVQERNLEFVVPCHARIGGVVSFYPLSVCYGDGI